MGDGVPVPVGEPVIITAPVHHAPVELNAPAGPRPSALLRQADFQRDMATAFPLARAAIEREVHLQKACDTADALAAHHGRLVEFVRTSQRFVSPDHRRARCWQFMIEAKNDILLAKDSNLTRSPGFEGLLPGGGQKRYCNRPTDDD